jgi:outer membrane murein-binding lipoprotein Lpp
MKRTIQSGVLVLAAASMTVLTSCSSKITDEQLATLKDLRQQEQTLNQQIRQKEGERDRLQGEVNARRAELDSLIQQINFSTQSFSVWIPLAFGLIVGLAYVIASAARRAR